MQEAKKEKEREEGRKEGVIKKPYYLSFPFFKLENMAAFKPKGPPSNNALGASMAPGQSASPPGDVLTSQLPVKVFTGNKKPFVPHLGYAILLKNSSQKGFFTSNISTFGVRSVPINPLTWNAGPDGGGPSGGVGGGSLKKAKATRKSVIEGGEKGFSKKNVYMQQTRTGRQATARVGGSAPLPSSTLKSRYKRASMYSKSVIPHKLGGGSLVRTPRAG